MKRHVYLAMKTLEEAKAIFYSKFKPDQRTAVEEISTEESQGRVTAEPIFGKSGLISTLVEADGLVRVERNTEGLYEGEQVRVLFIHPERGGLC